MATLRIYDLRQNALALDLHDIIRVLAPRSLQAIWTISTVKSSEPGHEWFEATGEMGEKLEALAQEDTRVPGSKLAALAEKTRQVIWGEFVGSLASKPDEKWIIVRAVDSTFYEVTTLDETVLNAIRTSFQDVRAADVPIA
jgi:hypothetical protein